MISRKTRYRGLQIRKRTEQTDNRTDEPGAADRNYRTSELTMKGK